MSRKLFVLAGSLVMASSAWSQESPWPGSPKMGVRAGVAGSTGTAGIDVGNVGMKVLLNDQMALVVDFGLRIDSSSNASQAAFALGGGLNLYLNDTLSALRPYVPVFLGFGVANSPGISTPLGTLGGSQSFQLGLGGGLGVEYFVSKNFSVSTDLILGVTFTNFNPFSISVGTLTPGVQVAYYFP